MKGIPRMIEIVSKALYWLSMGGVVATLLALIFIEDRQFAYACALASVVAMMVSSILLYVRNLLAVGKDISTKTEPQEGNDISEER